jgi:hypothetical protein
VRGLGRGGLGGGGRTVDVLNRGRVDELESTSQSRRARVRGKVRKRKEKGEDDIGRMG